MFNVKKIFFLLFLTVFTAELNHASSIDAYADNLNAGVILSNSQGEILYSRNPEKQFIPASILKILTSLAAFDILGKEYHFSTQYWFDEKSRDLYIKGLGDPLLISETIKRLSDKIILTLKTREREPGYIESGQINNIIIDQSFFAKQIKIPGKKTSLNPYDASIGALSANFNTINFKWDSHNNRYVSAEPQTPLLSIFYDDIKKTKLLQGRIILSQQESILYPGLLIKYFLEKSGLTINGSVQPGKLDTTNKNIESFQSPFKLTQIVQKLLKYSNNFMANQLLLTMGAKVSGEPATLEKGTRALKLFLKQNLNRKAKQQSKQMAKQMATWQNIKIYEGSGLARSNLITPDQMLKILLKFMPYYSLLKNQGNDFYKTGTLSGVRTRAGYIMGADNKLYPYVIMVNQKGKGYEPILSNLMHRVSKL
jgi:serine-type D-Ala-D-Ala carboxypeptidase/endopeptidase (penicillin-binding protein 4)